VIKRHLPAITPDAETTLWGLEAYQGRSGAEAALDEWLRSFEGASFELRQFVNTDAKEMLCIGELAGRGAGSGADVDRQLFFLITVEGGDAMRLRIIQDEAEALEAVGLRE
jgi:hypothetical protein